MEFKHHLFISAGNIDCSKPTQDVVDMIQLLIDYAYKGNRVALVKSFTVLDENTCEIVIERLLTTEYCLAYGPNCISEYDESLLSGLETPYFSMRFGSTAIITPVVSPLLPATSACYSPKVSFINFWKETNKKHAGEEIQRIKITTTTKELKIQVKFPRKTVGNQKRYADDVHDLEMELGDTLDHHRGETLSWPLWEMGEICARKYLKRRSYDGLVGYLKKTYDINLDIKDC